MEYTTVKNKVTDILVPLDSQMTRSEQPLPTGMYLNWLILGPRGSGKTSEIIQVVTNKGSPWYQAFDTIHVISSTCKNDPKWEPLLDEVSDCCHSDISNETIESIIDTCQKFNDHWKELPKKEKGDPPSHLVIYDDVIHLLPRSTAKNSRANQIFVNNRHLKLTNVILSQKFNGGVSPLIRANIDLLSVFPFQNEKEVDGICDEFNIKRDLYSYATEEAHSFLHINMLRKPIYFKKFDRVLEKLH
jgi:hypothetical protein